MLAAGMIVVSTAGYAAPVTWDFKGHLTDVEGNLIPGQHLKSLHRRAARATNSNVLVRDNFQNIGDPDPVDGYTFGLTSNGGTVLQLLMRGPIVDSDPDIVTGPGLPTFPDPRLAGLAVSAFQVCDGPDCSNGFLNGTIDSVTGLPEPGTLGLIGVAMAGLAWRRRKH